MFLNLHQLQNVAMVHGHVVIFGLHNHSHTDFHFKVNGYTLRGSYSAIIIVSASIINKSQLLKKRICSSWSKFFPSRLDSILKGFIIQTANRISQKLLPLVKDGGKKM